MFVEEALNIEENAASRSRVNYDKANELSVRKADNLAYPIRENIVKLVEKPKTINIEEMKENMTKIHVVIPARLKSTRLPRKMLADIAGKPMIQWVHKQVSKSKFDSIIIATDSQEIKQAAEAFGARVVLTRDDHESGADRIAEAVTNLDFIFKNDDIVVNVQGDEPLIPFENIEQTAQLLLDRPDAVVSTLCEKITNAEDIYDPNNVKVVFDKNNYALYFSRASIPFERGFSELEEVNIAEFFRHIGIYAYRVGFLKQYTKLPVSPIEKYESLEQLRVLYNGYKIAVDQAIKPTPAGVDTPQDLERMRRIFNRRQNISIK